MVVNTLLEMLNLFNIDQIIDDQHFYAIIFFQYNHYLGSNTYLSKYIYFESLEILINTFVLVFGMFNVHCCKPINFFVCMFNGDLR